MSRTITKENRQAEAVPEETSYLRPRVDITETREGYELRAEMPGVDKQGLELLLDGSELTIVGRRQPWTESLECIHRQSRVGNYRRKFELDPAIDTAKVTAKMERGVLVLTLPKAERVKPRRIQVTD